MGNTRSWDQSASANIPQPSHFSNTPDPSVIVALWGLMREETLLGYGSEDKEYSSGGEKGGAPTMEVLRISSNGRGIALLRLCD